MLRTSFLSALRRRMRNAPRSMHRPGLWVPLRKEARYQAGWEVVGLCEHAGGWHIFESAARGRVARLDSDYFELLEPAVLRLAGVAFSDDVRAEL